MADVRVRVIGEDEASRELSKVDKSLSGFKDSFTELKSQLDLAREGLDLFIGTFEKAFELGRQGAVFQQTTESFDGLLQKVGAAPDLLDQLRTASRGTVDDLTLMSSSLTLAAGAGDDFAKDLLNATPRLLEIAKASNKLNPTLGDTAFLFESIALGIKRGSPLILDNLGITVKLEEAYTEYAKTLGKAATELTSTEQKQALLNKVMAAGDTLIQQAGGSAAAATDDFDRLTASMENIGNEIKASLVPWLSRAAQALETLLTANRKFIEATKEHGAQVAATAGSYEEYAAEMERALKVQGLSTQLTEDGLRVFAATGSGLRDVTAQYGVFSRGMYEAYLMANNLQGAYDGVAGGQARMNLTTEQVIAAQERLSQTTAELTEEQKKYLAELDKIALQAGLAGQIANAWDEYKQKSIEVRQENAALRVEIEKLIAEGVNPAGEEVQALTDKMDKNLTEQQKLAEATNKTTREFIYQKAVANMDEGAALELARALGVLSETDYSLARQVIDLTDRLNVNADTMITADEITQEYLAQIKLLADSTKVAESNTADFIDETEAYIASAQKAYSATKEWGGAQAALNAGLAGTYSRAVEQYREKIAQTAAENARLTEEYRNLTLAGGDTAESLARITEQINANNDAQREAHEMLRKSTAEMIYQQAAAGLSAEDALYLARAMGLISEEDYRLVSSLQELRRQFDANADGMITAEEGARRYTQQVIALYQSVDRLNQSLAASPFGGGGGGGAVGGGFGHVGNGIYVGGANESIGPGGTGPLAPSGATVTMNYTNNGVTLSDEADLQRMLTPIVNNILEGR